MKRKNNLIYLLPIMLIGLWSCNSSKNDTENLTDEVQTSKTHIEGKQLLEAKCYSCHNPTAGVDERLAPTMNEIKSSYMNSFKSKEEFIRHFVDFVMNPQKEKSVIPEAIKKYNLMPKMNFNEKELELMAEYLFSANPEELSATAADKQITSSYSATELEYLKKGKKIALTTKKNLGKNLMSQLNKNGTVAALTFCSRKAHPIIDSMETVLQAKISRKTDKPRNPNSLAQGNELNYIQEMKGKIAKGEQPVAKIQKIEDKMVGYYPIMTNDMCLQCHGIPNKNIKPETLKKIKELYPNDQATGYQANQLRGMWVIEMD